MQRGSELATLRGEHEALTSAHDALKLSDASKASAIAKHATDAEELRGILATRNVKVSELTNEIVELRAQALAAAVADAVERPRLAGVAVVAVGAADGERMPRGRERADVVQEEEEEEEEEDDRAQLLLEKEIQQRETTGKKKVPKKLWPYQHTK